MTTIKLNNYYPHLTESVTLEVSEEIAVTLSIGGRMCDSYKRRNDDIYLNENVYQSEKLTGTRNRSIAYLLTSEGVLNGEPESILDLYFRICSVMVTAKDLAHYALVLSCKGTDPFTGEQIISPDIVQTVITLMFLCGMYDESGEYAVRVGLPSKSGVGGGIIAVGRDGIGIGTFGPMLNQIGNSVGGKKIIQHLSENLGLHMFSK